jgi:hypothetical protein
MQKHWINSWLGATLLLSSMQVIAADQTFFRYKDKDGNQVMSNTLPSEVAKDGYEVITSRGNVIERVAPQKTSEELAKDKAFIEQQQATRLEEENKKRQDLIRSKKDEILLKTFSNEIDIIRSRDEKIASINVLEEIMRENVARLKKQLEVANIQATGYTTAKKPIPASLQKTISESKRQIEENMNFLERKKIEKEEINKKYQGLITRFNELNKKTKED